MTGSLEGIKIASFYPWRATFPSGARTRFACLWRYFLSEGAHVTIPTFDDGKDIRFRNFSIHSLGFLNFFLDPEKIDPIIAQARKSGLFVNLTPEEELFLILFEEALYFEDPRIKPWTLERISEVDIVTIDYPMMVPALAPLCRQLGKPLIVTAHDALFELHGKNPVARNLLQQNEVNALKQADAVFYASEHDRDVFQKLGVQGSVIINTIGTRDFTPGDEEASLRRMRELYGIKEPAFALFVGSAHAPNIDAAKYLAEIAPKYPGIAFVVAGHCAPQGKTGNFYALGLVSDLILDQLYRGASSIIIPLKSGSGSSLKIVEAMAYGKPIVSTSVGIRGHHVQNDNELIICDDLQHFGDVVTQLASNNEKRSALGSAVRAYALKQDFRNTSTPYRDAILRLLKRPIPPAARPRSRGLVIIDNNLTSIVGHHFTYAETIVKEAERQGIPCRILANKEISPEVSKTLPVYGTFSQGVHQTFPNNPYNGWDDIWLIYDFLASNHNFYDEFAKTLEKHVDLEDVVFLPNATFRQVLAIGALLNHARFSVTPKFVFLFRYELFTAGISKDGVYARTPNKSLIDLYVMAFKKLEALATHTSLRLVTDSKDLSEEFQQLTHIPFGVLPIPHAASVAQPMAIEGVPLKQRGVPRIVYLGDAREEKGFETIAPMLQSLFKKSPSLPVQFVMQAFVSSSYHARMVNEIHSIKNLGFPQVTLLERPLSIAEYNAFLESADLVILPYNPTVYTTRTSGPFVEAISRGKPVVVSNDSWMSRQLGDSQAGVTFKFNDAEDFVRAMLVAFANLSTLIANARSFGEKYSAYHNPKVFVDELMR